MNDKEKKKPFVDELFEDLEKQFKSPSPKTISGKVENFERLLTRTLLPFFGINAFLIGSLIYYSQTESILIPAGLSFALMTVWGIFFPHIERAKAWLHLGGLAAMVLMLLLAIPNQLIALIFALAATASLIFSIIRGLVPEKAIFVYIIYLPIIVAVEIPDDIRLVFELLTLVPMAFLFIKSRLRTASFATLIGAVIAGLQELDIVGQGNLLLMILMGGVVVASIIYEWRIPRTEVSSLREFLGQGLTMILTFIAIATFTGPGEPFTWWLWASVTSVYNILKMIIERLAYPTRAGWVAVNFSVCLWSQTPDLPWEGEAVGTFILAATLHLIANLLPRRFLATLALIIATVPTLFMLFKSFQSVSVQVLVTCILSVAFLLLASHTRPDPEKLPWWRGFLRAEHNEFFRNLCLGTIAQLLRIPFMQTLFSWIRTGFMWMKYIKGNSEPFSLSDLLFAAAHVLAALVISNQLTLLLASGDASLGIVSLIIAPVWALWGLGLIIAGTKREILYFRLLGTIFITYPLFVELIVVRSEDTLVLALLSLIIGFSMWVAGIVVRRLPPANTHRTVSSNNRSPDNQRDQ